MRIVDGDVDSGTGRQKLHPLRRVAAHHDLRVHFLAGLVDAAVSEDRAAQERLRLFQIEVRTEIPRADAFVPIASGIGSVAIFLRGHDEMNAAQRLPGAFVFLFAFRVLVVPVDSKIGIRRDGDAVRVGGAGPEDFVVRRADRNLGARDRRGVVESRDEDQRVLRRVFDGDAEVRDLHDRARDILGIALRLGDGVARLDDGPDDPVANR